MNQWLTPFLAKHPLFRVKHGRPSNVVQRPLHLPNNLLSSNCRSYDPRDDANVLINVGQAFWRKSQEPGSRPNDLGNRFFLIRNGRDNKVGPRGDDFIRLRRPRILDNELPCCHDLRADIGAVLGTCHKLIQFPQIGQRDRDTRLQGCYAKLSHPTIVNERFGFRQTLEFIAGPFAL